MTDSNKKHSEIDSQSQTLKIEKPEAQEQKGKKKPTEIDGPKGLEPTRYGDWEAKGRCYDF